MTNEKHLKKCKPLSEVVPERRGLCMHWNPPAGIWRGLEHRRTAHMLTRPDKQSKIHSIGKNRESRLTTTPNSPTQPQQFGLLPFKQFFISGQVWGSTYVRSNLLILVCISRKWLGFEKLLFFIIQWFPSPLFITFFLFISIFDSSHMWVGPGRGREKEERKRLLCFLSL